MQGIVNPGGDSPTSADACFFVVQLLFVTAGAATPPAAGATAQAASINLEGCYYRDRRSELTGDALTPRTVEMVGGKASLYGGRSPWFPLVRGLEVLGSPGDAGSYSLSCLNYWDCTTCANSVDEVKEGLAANRMTFWDSCHSLCFPDNCGECDDFKTNAELIAEVDAGTQSYQSTPRPNAECDAVKAPLANLPYTLADVSVVSGASFTRIALDPSPPSTPPSPPPSASPSPPPSTSPSPPPPDCASPIARWGSGCDTGCCGAGDDCFKQNQFYSQCRPVGDCPAGWACQPGWSEPSPPPPSAPASPSPPPPVVDPP